MITVSSVSRLDENDTRREYFVREGSKVVSTFRVKSTDDLAKILRKAAASIDRVILDNKNASLRAKHKSRGNK